MERRERVGKAAAHKLQATRGPRPVAVMCARDSFLSERLADQRGSGIALLSRGLLDENVRYLGAA